MTESTYKKMQLRTVYNATLGKNQIKVWKTDNGDIVDFDEPTKEYGFESIILVSVINH